VEGAWRARSRLLLLLQAGGAADDGDGGLGGDVLAEDGGLLLPGHQYHSRLNRRPLVEVRLELAVNVVGAGVQNVCARELGGEGSKLIRVYKGVDNNLADARHRLVPGHLRAGEVAVAGTGVRLKVSGRDHRGRA
jgi:hypothetical protein